LKCAHYCLFIYYILPNWKGSTKRLGLHEGASKYIKYVCTYISYSMQKLAIQRICTKSENTHACAHAHTHAHAHSKHKFKVTKIIQKPKTPLRCHKKSSDLIVIKQ